MSSGILPASSQSYYFKEMPVSVEKKELKSGTALKIIGDKLLNKIEDL